MEFVAPCRLPPVSNPKGSQRGTRLRVAGGKRSATAGWEAGHSKATPEESKRRSRCGGSPKRASTPPGSAIWRDPANPGCAARSGANGCHPFGIKRARDPSAIPLHNKTEGNERDDSSDHPNPLPEGEATYG